MYNNNPYNATGFYPCPSVTRVPPPSYGPPDDSYLERRLRALAPPPAVKPGGAWHKRALHRLRYVPAVDAANALDKLYAGDGGLLVVPEPLTNSLLISAVPEALEEVTRLIDQVDLPPKSVAIDALLAEIRLSDVRPAATGKQSPGAGRQEPESSISSDDIKTQLAALTMRGELLTRFNPRLMTLDNQQASISVGTTNFWVTPRVSDDGLVTMQIHLGLTPPVSREPITMQFVIAVPSGRTARIAGLSGPSSAGPTELVLLLTPRIIAPEAKSAAGRSASR
jgi:hypothetical protein